jgi:hypothetical protein
MRCFTGKALKRDKQIMARYGIRNRYFLICIILLSNICVACSPAIRHKSGSASIPTKSRQSGNNDDRPYSRDPRLEEASKLFFDRRQLAAAGPIMLQQDQLDLFVRELWVVQWRPDDPIYLYVIIPKGVKNPPLVLYLYSYPSELDRFRDDRYCRAVTKGGTAAIGFCSALTGHRYKNRPMKEWFVSELREALVLTVHDIQMILDYLQARGDLDITRAGIYGQGSGGTIAVLAASLDARIKALDLVNPWADWPSWMRQSSIIPDEERKGFLEQKYLSQIAELDPLQWFSKIADKPLRINLISSDPMNPDICLKHIAESAPSRAVVQSYPDSRAHADSLVNSPVFSWITEVLSGMRTNDVRIHDQ